jgi:hypothetical protein
LCGTIVPPHARARLDRESFELRLAPRLVDGMHRAIEDRVAREHLPFPVAEVRRQQKHRAPGPRFGIDDVRVLDHDPRRDLRR